MALDRSDDCINIFELKFYKELFTTTEKCFYEMEEKIRDFKRITKTKKTVIPVIITSNGCVKNEYYKGVFSKEIKLVDLIN